MANTNEKLKRLKEIHSQEEAIFAERNEKYGDSFSRTFEKRGPTVALIRLDDKLSRVDYLLSHDMMESDGESVIDTLMDLSNYANMTIMELIGETESLEKSPSKKARKSRKSGKETTVEGGPLGHFSKRQLVEIISQLGGTVPKKANREKLISTIEEYPKAKAAVAITSLKAQSESVEDEDDGDEEE